MKKLAAIIAAVGLSLCSLTGCAQSGVKNSAQATAENPMILTLAHGLSETHTVHIAMTEFADKVKERTNGRIQIQIFQTDSWDLKMKYGAADGRRYLHDKGIRTWSCYL